MTPLQIRDLVIYSPRMSTIKQPVGCYVIKKELQYTFTYRPNWLHRIMTRFFLG